MATTLKTETREEIRTRVRETISRGEWVDTVDLAQAFGPMDRAMLSYLGKCNEAYRHALHKQSKKPGRFPKSPQEKRWDKVRAAHAVRKEMDRAERLGEGKISKHLAIKKAAARPEGPKESTLRKLLGAHGKEKESR